MSALGIFTVEIFPDGARFEDVQAAVQAAWLAGEHALAVELAKRYGFYDQLCLRCVNAYISAASPPLLLENQYYYQLCNECVWIETQPSRTRRRLKQRP